MRYEHLLLRVSLCCGLKNENVEVQRVKGSTTFRTVRFASDAVDCEVKVCPKVADIVFDRYLQTGRDYQADVSQAMHIVKVRVISPFIRI